MKRDFATSIANAQFKPMQHYTRQLSGLLLIGLMLAGCAADRPTYQAKDIEAENLEPVSTEYEIGAGDTIEIFVWDHPDLSTNVEVRPDGRISTPLVEDLKAAGRTPTQLARDIEELLSEYIRSPIVTVIMQGFVGEQSQQIRVVGQAVEPRAIQYRQGMTLLDVVIEVGGLSEFAAGNRAKIVRRLNGKEIEIKVRLDDLVNRGRTDQNVVMYPGDVLIVPESFF